ncbi:hypothetical protein WMY93_018920 [Mugilogobius chulae]|uniref:Protein eyes shut homolog n=1 Tax=Mugilogobius chulae TaxID=88201 RepID=A0AAW0NKP5_9GOBI
MSTWEDCAFSPCQNGGSCVDLIDKFACFCPDGYTGKTCENDMDVCTKAAHKTTLCFNGGTCLEGKGSNFTCSCPPGFTGDFCEVDFNECCSAPCHNGGICQDLINSYVCHCRSGWTGLHCEDDINECLPQPCDRGICIQNHPGYGYTCFCRPGFVGKNCEHNYDDCLSNPCPPAFSSKVQYLGNSFLEFDGIELNPLNNITLRFQTRSAKGTLVYMDQGPANSQFFFIKVFISEGVLEYLFSCHEEDDMTQISTSVKVDDDTAHIINIRQYLNPCEAELTLSGHNTIKSPVSNYWSGHILQRTNHIFVGGLPLNYPFNQKAESVHNFTGCIEIIEINKRRTFYTSDAIANSNTGNAEKTLSDGAPVCIDGLCQNGGTCYIEHHFNKLIPLCYCSLHFTGPFCETAQTQNLGEEFVHVFLEDGSPVAQLSCGSNHVLSVTAEQSISTDRWVNLTVRYNLPVGKQGGSCMIEIAVDNGPAQRLEEYVSQPVWRETFGPIFLGALSSHWEMPGVGAKGVQRFMGCIREFWVNSKEIYLVGEGTTGRNIKNCEPLVCHFFLAEMEEPVSVVNITRPRFSGNDEFGYTSFLAYTSVPSLAFFYEFKLKFILANNSSAVKDNLILFAGYKGQVVHRFNLGSGVATIVSDRLDQRVPIHTVMFGRAKRTGWLKVDGQHNRTGSSRGPLLGLSAFHQLFVGGYNEYTPELLPLGSRFRHGFQGDFFCLSLTSGHVQLRYNLGDGTHILRSSGRVDPSGRAWHRVKAGRIGPRGFLSLDNKEITHTTTTQQRMTTLDVATDFFVGGVSSLSLVASDATEGAPMGFTGGLRELIVNGLDLDLSERGAVSGANVGDWDGTACGYKVCQNQGRCVPIDTDSFMCVCPSAWTGPVCNQSAGVDWKIL